MKDLIFVAVTMSIILVDFFVLQFYIESIKLLLQKKRKWIVFLLFWIGIILLQTLFYSWLPGRMGGEISYFDGLIVLQDGALIRNCGFIILVHEMAIGISLLKYIWNVIRKRDKFYAKLFFAELLVGILFTVISIPLIRNDYVVTFKGGGALASIVTVILALIGIYAVFGGMKEEHAEKKRAKTAETEKSSTKASGDPMEKRLCYCKNCVSYFIISPDKTCPKCRGQMISSAITEKEWKQSNDEQKAAFKASLAVLGRDKAPGQDTTRHAGAAQEQKSTPTSKPKRKSPLGKLLLLLVVGIAIFMFLQSDGASKDYPSAGEKLYKQIVKYEPEVSVSYNSDHYNRFIGINEDITNIIKEACKNNGNPQEGDHLAWNTVWTDGEYTAVEKNNGTHDLNIKLTMEYRTTEEQEKALKNRADAILAKLNLNGASEYEKVRAIYNYICSNVTYDYDHLNDTSYKLQYTAYAAAFNGTAVCAGVADFFYYLATAAGLEARITINDTHAWNIVKVSGKYYYLDPTWDLGLSEGEYRYFLRGSGDFVSILNGPEYAAHRESLTVNIMKGSQHPLTNVQKEYKISETAYSR